MHSDHVIQYLIKSLKGELSPAESEYLEAWMALSPDNRVTAEEFLDKERLKGGIQQLYDSRTRIWNRLTNQAEISSPAPVIRPNWRRWVAAAALLALISTTAYLWLRTPVQNNKVVAGSNVPPGGNKAMLTLEDGSVILLDSAVDGVIHAGITKNKAVLAYTTGNKESSGTIAYNTLTTPRGGQYQLVLPDGTRVWLNAASSLKYPVSFSGRERTVELQGEAYFEIADNASAPFKVSAYGSEVQVLGTRFNLMAYKEEPAIVTTLVQGGVKVLNGSGERVLTPGEQSVITDDGEFIVQAADTRQALAWKNGLFSFKDAGIRVIMRQISRWYDVDVEYRGDVPNRSFSGYVFRNLTLLEVLNVLELSDIRCKIEGKKIIITP